MKLTTQSLKNLIKEELASLSEEMEEEAEDSPIYKIMVLITSNDESNYKQAMMLIESMPELQNSQKLKSFIYDYSTGRAFEDALAQVVGRAHGPLTLWLANLSPVYARAHEENVQHLYETIDDYL